MAKRQKRLKKGIESLKEQKKIHEEKRKIAEGLGDEELAGYYTAEIEKFEKEIGKKMDIIEK